MPALLVQLGTAVRSVDAFAVEQGVATLLGTPRAPVLSGRCRAIESELYRTPLLPAASGWVTSPSTHTVGSRSSHDAIPRLNARTEKTLRPSTSVASTFTRQG